MRWHLDGIPNAVDLKEWKLRIEGNVAKPLGLESPGADADLQARFLCRR